MSAAAGYFETYLHKLRKTPLNEHTELTGRSALEELLNQFADGKTKVQHEPKKIADKGAPDFKVRRQGMILGYVEVKAVGENLDKVLKSEQIGRYRTLSQNIILTDYLYFAWINKDGIQREPLCHASDLESRKFRPREDRVTAVAKLLEGFFSIAPEGIGRSQQLALATAAVPLLYRPFDSRWTIWDRNVAVHRRERVMRHMLQGNNIGLITSRLTKGEDFRHAQVTNQICEVICLSPKTSNNGFLFPLYLRSASSQVSENISTDFRAFIDSRFEHHYTPEEILGYIYAVLHAPAYRKRYAALLRRDFPRAPFPTHAGDFERLSGLGWALVQAHLLRELPRRALAAYQGKGDHKVESVNYAPKEQTIHINKTQSFHPVPSDVWDFHVGGYQVLDKYLKSRRGRVLSLDEINHVGAVADSLAFTIEQMAEIDEAYQKAFPDRG